MATGNGAAIWSAVQRYFEIGCSRVLVTPYPRTRKDLDGLLTGLAPFVSRTSTA
jgi:hypothetical protein